MVEEERAGEEVRGDEGPGTPEEEETMAGEGGACEEAERRGGEGYAEFEDAESAALPELAPSTFFAVSVVRIMLSMLKMIFFTASLFMSFRLLRISAMLHFSVSNSGFAKPSQESVFLKNLKFEKRTFI